MTDTSLPPTHDSSSAISFTELVDAVRSAYQSGRTRPMAWRKAQLQGLLAFLTDHEQDLLDALHADLGRPVAEAFGADIGISRLHIKHTLRHFERWARPQRISAGMLSMPAKARVMSEPLGVALIIAPWNYPIQLLVEPMAAAIAAGNAVIAKPSELAPACSSVVSRCLPKYLDTEAIAIVEGGVEETTSLLEEPFDHILFTGSTNVGKVVMAAAAKHLTPVTLELGGKSPTIVAADANIEVAARRIAWGKLMNAGQTCIAPDYVLVDNAVKDRFVDALCTSIRGFYGDQVSTTPDFGRIVSSRHHTRLVNLIKTGGGSVAIGNSYDAESKFLAPTVVVDPDVESALMNEEIFGPILPIVGVESVDAAIKFVTSRPKPLALYVFSKSSATVSNVLASTTSGGACVNHVVMHIMPENLPFGGVGPSGMGAYHGKAGFDTFSHRKSVVHKPTWPDPTLLYPPYDDWKQKVLRVAMR